MSEKQSRLAGIQDMVLNSTKDTFFDQAIVLDLLAVVEAELSRATPQGLASAYRTFSTVTELPKWQKGQAIKRADAWDALAAQAPS